MIFDDVLQVRKEEYNDFLFNYKQPVMMTSISAKHFIYQNMDTWEVIAEQDGGIYYITGNRR